MNKYILAKVKGPFINFFIKKCLQNNIYLKNIDYLDDTTLKVVCLKKDYLYIRKNFKDYKIKKIKVFGIDYIKTTFKENSLILFGFLFGIILLYFLSNVTLEVKVVHSNSELRNIVNRELKDMGLKRYAYKKSYSALTKIKNTILTNYKDQIEWIEIENVGMNYIVRLEERIIKDIKKDERKCNIVATKDAVVLNIFNSNGLSLVNMGDFVNKGDVLISGAVIYNNEIKSETCANGTIYGEVWYTVDISIPLNYEIRKSTGKKRYNIKYKNNLDEHKIFRSKYQSYQEENKKLFSVLGTNIYLVKEAEEKVEYKKYTPEEALKVGEDKAIESILKKLGDNERILSKKVLKKSLNDSTMDIEIFITVSEVVSEVLVYG